MRQDRSIKTANNSLISSSINEKIQEHFSHISRLGVFVLLDYQNLEHRKSIPSKRLRVKGHLNGSTLVEKVFSIFSKTKDDDDFLCLIYCSCFLQEKIK